MVYAAAILAAATATPAFAQTAPFTGGHIEAITGWDHPAGVDANDGIIYGIGAGYDFQTGGAVFGVEVEAAESTAGDCSGGVCVDAGRDLYVGGRVGAVVGSNTLIYGKVGYTNARVEATSGGTSAHLNLDGIRAGGGAEFRFANSPLSLRTEYRYSNYELDGERHQAVLGLGLRF
jgi:outer membrane immunogenic protein